MTGLIARRAGVAALLVVLVAGASGAGAAVRSGAGAQGWGKAIEIPGLGSLSKSGFILGGVSVQVLSCGAPGDCSVGGNFITSDGGGRYRAFLDSEVKG